MSDDSEEFRSGSEDEEMSDYGASDADMDVEDDDDDYGFAGAEEVSTVPKASGAQSGSCFAQLYLTRLSEKRGLDDVRMHMQVPYKVLPKEDLNKQREKALREVMDVLGIDEDTAMRVLRKYKW